MGRTEDDPLLVADLSQALQPPLRRRDVPTLTQNGLDHNTSDLVCGDLLLEEQGQVGEGELGHLLDGSVGGDVELGSVGEGSGVNPGLIRIVVGRSVSGRRWRKCGGWRLRGKRQSLPNRRSWKLEKAAPHLSPWLCYSMEHIRRSLVMAEVA